MTKKEKWLRVLEYCLPAIITIAIFVLAMIIKGVYPFGKNNIGYIDYNEQTVPFFTGLWDILHGKASSFIDYNLGAGGSIVTSLVINGFLSPISWLIAIFPRADIIFAIPFIMIIRFALMATTAYFCFKYFFKNTSKWVLLTFTIFWTFSGWTLVHFTNVGWLDIITLFPLLIMAAKPLIEKGKNLWFVILLTVMLCLSYYLTYMVLVGIVVVSLYYVIFVAKEKKKVASHLFFAIIISILLSFVAFIPSCLTSLGAHRFSGGDTENIHTLFKYFFSKVIVVFMYSLPFVFFVRLMFKIKEDKKNVLFFLVTFITLAVGILIEPINKMWHTGSYYSYPMRYGFILIMFAIFAALYYINKYLVPNPENAATGEEKKAGKYDLVLYILCPTLGILFCILAVGWASLGINIHPYKAVSFYVFLIAFLIFAVSYALIELLLRINCSKLKLGNLNCGIFIFILVLVQALCGMVGMTAIGGNNTNTSRITNVYNLDLSKLDSSYKIKDREDIYNANFAALTKFPTLQTWIHISPEEQYQAYDSLGINTSDVILKSSGGTILTDILLGNKYVLSLKELDSRYYTKLDEFDFTNEYYQRADDSDDYEFLSEKMKVNLYELNFNFSKIFTTNVDLNDIFTKDSSYFDRQNELFKALYDQDFNILSEKTFNVTEDDDYFYISVSGLEIGQIAYLSLDFDEDLKIEDEPANRTLLRGINDLGVLTSNSLTVKARKADNDDLTVKLLTDKLEFATFDISTFKTIHDAISTSDSTLEIKGKSLEITINNTQNHKYAFVPFTYLKNMTAEVNGKSAKVTPTLSSFMQVDLSEGENNIKITYHPQYLLLCGIVSIVALLIFVLFAFINHKFDLANKKFVVWTGFIGACVILLAVGFLVYLKPLFSFFVALFKG